MKSSTMTRPSVLLTSACAPSAMLSAAAPVALLATERAPISRVHQILTQAELAMALVLAGGINGTTAFKGVDTAKRYTASGSGVPPRGRPV
ncbi:hypothetical protein ACWKSP_09315 [Micromonosporaceae bacterium Da 78-11]